MSLIGISSSERMYIVQGCNSNVRSDGRKCKDCRKIFIEDNIFPHVHGSSRVKIGNSIDVLCSVKVEVGEYNNTSSISSSSSCSTSRNINNNKGMIECNVDISPSCNLRVDHMQLQDYGKEIASHINNSYIGRIDLTELCIIPDKFYWIIYIDVLLLQVDGDPVFASSLASYIALKVLNIPKVKLINGESGEPDDFDVCGDVVDATTLDVSNVPIIINISKIGDALVIDTSDTEMMCSSYSLNIATNQNGTCCNISKSKTGNIGTNDIQNATDMAASAAIDIFNHINKSSLLKATEGYVIPNRMGLFA